MATSDAPITIKKYANRRLYDASSGTHTTLEALAEIAKAGEDFVVYDAKGEDITRSVLTQIVFEQREQGRAEPSAHQFPALAYPLLRGQHADARVALS
jgi:polyhydroxyalkanoate synthesis repressor PhaR